MKEKSISKDRKEELTKVAINEINKMNVLQLEYLLAFIKGIKK